MPSGATAICKVGRGAVTDAPTGRWSSVKLAENGWSARCLFRERRRHGGPISTQIPMETQTMLNTRSLGTSLDRMLTLNRALDQAFNGVGGSRVWVPALDVAERGDAYLIYVELPGVSPENVDVSF